MLVFWNIFLLTIFMFTGGVCHAGAASMFERNVVEFRLANGMKWLLLKRGNAPVFSGIIQVKVGGVEEEQGKTGLAHMLEHMAFKGTKDISSQELWDAFVTNGAADLNAYTSKDITAYYAKMPSNKLELWLYLNSEMIKHSVMREFYEERDVVTEELVGKIENNPWRKMDKSLLETAFVKSPYRWQTIGSKEDVTGLKPEDLEAFKKRYYVPDRMVGSVVGDIDVEKTKEMIEKYFASIPGPRKTPENLPMEDRQDSVRRAEVKFDASPILMIAYHKPTLPAFDDYVFDLIFSILCDGENARLRKELVYNKKLVRSVGCDSSTPGTRLDNLFVISAEPISSDFYDEIEETIDLELNKLAASAPTNEELKRVRNNVMKEFIFGLLDNDGIAHNLAFYETVVSDWRYMTRHGSVIEKIGPADVMAVAKKYFRDDNKTVIRLIKP